MVFLGFSHVIPIFAAELPPGPGIPWNHQVLLTEVALSPSGGELAGAVPWRYLGICIHGSKHTHTHIYIYIYTVNNLFFLVRVPYNMGCHGLPQNHSADVVEDSPNLPFEGFEA